MQTSRSPAVAGSFYPSDPSELVTQVRGFLHAAKPSGRRPRAIIAPHAGYAYSGPIAGSAYAPVARLRGAIDRVVLLGPCHREYVAGIAASRATAFATPLGNVALDQPRIQRLVEQLDFVEFSDRAHQLEHSLEVQLPFLQCCLGEFSVLPFAVGGALPEQVETLLDTLGCDESTLIVVSSDLSHYHDYRSAQQIDRFTTAKIEHLDPAGLTGENACGQRPVCGLLRYASKHGLRCETVDLRNSGDTAGTRDKVVGYGAYLFYEQARDPS